MISGGPVSGRRERLGLNGMILISVLLHAVVLILLFLSPSFPSPKLTFGPVYTVSLVSPPGEMRSPRSAPSVARELVPSSRSETVLKRQPDTLPSVPIRTLEKSRKRDPNLEKAMAEIRKRAAAAPAEVKQPQVKAPAEVRGGAASQSGSAEIDAQMQAYYAAIWSRIKSRWVLAQATSEALEAVIDVTILRSGAVTEVKYEKRSGNPYFDDSAVRAIRKASPLPPLPAGIGESSIDVGIRFHSSELRR
ncbi:MAG: TonB family protein [Deltaproteobacteria bacterium]|nr:TonB family protein [Deltaproteobacteria bacterium]